MEFIGLILGAIVAGFASAPVIGSGARAAGSIASAGAWGGVGGKDGTD